MDFPKFVSLINNQALFFPSIATLQLLDPFEGQWPIKALDQFFSQLEKLQGNEQVQLEDTLTAIRRGTTRWNRFAAVNSWHINAYESMAMWKLYGDQIAVTSSFQRLCRAIQTDIRVYIGIVDYLDHFSDNMRTSEFLNLFMPLLVKNRSFEHERELRAVCTVHPENMFENAPPRFAEHLSVYGKELVKKGGLSVSVNLDVLIDAVYVSPKSPAWLKELTESVIAKYGFSFRVVQSELQSFPTYA